VLRPSAGRCARLRDSEGDLLVLLVLAEHAHKDGGGAWPSVQRIAQLARLSIRGTQSALRKLESAGVIEATPRTGTTTYIASSCPRRTLRGRSHRAPQRVRARGAASDRTPRSHCAPNRKEPSPNREKDFSHLDRSVIYS